MSVKRKPHSNFWNNFHPPFIFFSYCYIVNTTKAEASAAAVARRNNININKSQNQGQEIKKNNHETMIKHLNFFHV